MSISFTYTCKYSKLCGFGNPGGWFSSLSSLCGLGQKRTFTLGSKSFKNSSIFKNVLFYSNSRCTFVMQSDENTDCEALFENSDPFTAAGRAGIRRPWFLVLSPPF